MNRPPRIGRPRDADRRVLSAEETAARNEFLTANRPAFYWVARYYVYRRPRARLDADDLAQDLAVAALRSFDSFDPDRGTFTTWLVQLCRSVLSAQRAAARCQRRIPPGRLCHFEDAPTLPGGPGSRPETPGREPEPLAVLLEAERREIVRTALMALHAAARDYFVHAHGFTAGRPRAGDRWRVVGAKPTLRRLLGAYVRPPDEDELAEARRAAV